VFGNADEKLTAALRGLPVNEVFAIFPAFVVNPEPPTPPGAHDAETAKLAEVAKDAVPNNEPVIPPEFMRSEPVINVLLSVIPNTGPELP
jgi:hypothetical protein